VSAQQPSSNIEATTNNSVIFTGIVQDVQPGALKVMVDEVIYGEGLQNGTEINVIYNSTKANVFLGSVSIGDKVIVFGELSGDVVYVNSNQYGIVNLKYVEPKHFEKSFSKSEELNVFVPYKFSVAGANVQLLVQTSAALNLTMNVEGDYYGISREGTPGVLKIMPSPSSGDFTLTISLQLSVNGNQYSYSYTWNRVFNMTLGKQTSIDLGTLPIQIANLGLASAELDITPIVSITPISFGYEMESHGPLEFYGEGEVFPLEWENNTSYIVPLIFTGDNVTSITGNPYITFAVELNAQINATVNYFLGSSTYNLGKYPLYSNTITLDLEPQGSELARFIPYYLLTIIMPNENVNATIDGHPEHPDTSGRIVTLLESGTPHVIEVPKIVNISDTERMVFVNWSNGVTENTISFSITQDTVLVPFYKTQYKLTIISEGNGTINPPPGEYWVDANSSVTINATPVNGGYIKGWIIDGTPLNRNATSLTVVMDRPHTIEVIFSNVTPSAGLNGIVVQGGIVTIAVAIIAAIVAVIVKKRRK
jgi:uncharacterized protein YheU (UPF0270 family)